MTRDTSGVWTRSFPDDASKNRGRDYPRVSLYKTPRVLIVSTSVGPSALCVISRTSHRQLRREGSSLHVGWGLGELDGSRENTKEAKTTSHGVPVCFILLWWGWVDAL